MLSSHSSDELPWSRGETLSIFQLLILKSCRLFRAHTHMSLCVYEGKIITQCNNTIAHSHRIEGHLWSWDFIRCRECEICPCLQHPLPVDHWGSIVTRYRLTAVQGSNDLFKGFKCRTWVEPRRWRCFEWAQSLYHEFPGLEQQGRPMHELSQIVSDRTGWSTRCQGTCLRMWRRWTRQRLVSL